LLAAEAQKKATGGGMGKRRKGQLNFIMLPETGELMKCFQRAHGKKRPKRKRPGEKITAGDILDRGPRRGKKEKKRLGDPTALYPYRGKQQRPECLLLHW